MRNRSWKPLLLSRFLLPLVTLVTGGCSDAVEQQDFTPEQLPGQVIAVDTIGPDGGELRADGIRLVVPSGALKKSTTIVISKSPGDVDGYRPYSAIYHFSPSGLTFDAPAEVQFKYRREILPPHVFWTDADEPTEFSEIESDAGWGTVVAQVKHFSSGFVGAEDPCVSGELLAQGDGFTAQPQQVDASTPGVLCVQANSVGDQPPDVTIDEEPMDVVLIDASSTEGLKLIDPGSHMLAVTPMKDKPISYTARFHSIKLDGFTPGQKNQVAVSETLFSDQKLVLDDSRRTRITMIADAEVLFTPAAKQLRGSDYAVRFVWAATDVVSNTQYVIKDEVQKYDPSCIKCLGNSSIVRWEGEVNSGAQVVEPGTYSLSLSVELQRFKHNDKMQILDYYESHGLPIEVFQNEPVERYCDALDPDRLSALDAFNDALEEDEKLSFSSEKWHADCSFGHIRLRGKVLGRSSSQLAIDRHGTVLPLSKAQKNFADRHLEHWGKIGLQSASYVNTMSDEDVSGFMVWYDPTKYNKDEIAARLVEFGPEVVVRSVPPLAFIQSTRAHLMSSLPYQDFVSVIHYEHPVAGNIGTGSCGHLYPGTNSFPEYPISALSTGSYETFNLNGIDGNGVIVGMLDVLPYGWSLFRDHEAFQPWGRFIPPPHAHVVQLRECSRDSECDAFGSDPCAFRGRCIDGHCVSTHATGTASMISSSNQAAGQGVFAMHASKATLVVVNNMIGSGIWQKSNDLLKHFPQQSGGLEYDEYNLWTGKYGQQQLFNVSVTGGESSQCCSDVVYNSADLAMDYFARKYDLLFVKSAGNYGNPISTNDNANLVTCNSFNALCVGSMESFDPDPPPLNPSQWNRVRSSSWKEPLFLSANPSRARQKTFETESPDIMAAVFRHASSVGTNQRGEPQGFEWRINVGTSFAAPAMTGLLALREQYCGLQGLGRGHSYTIRSAVRTLGFSEHFLEDASPCLNPEDFTPAYPTPHPTCDYRAGVGWIDAEQIKLTCVNPLGEGDGRTQKTPGVRVVEGRSSPNSGDWFPIPRWLDSHRFFRALVADPGRRVQIVEYISDPVALLKGSRHRASHSYLSCPHSKLSSQAPVPIDDNRVAVNFDLALCGKPSEGGTPFCVGLSESFDDTDEGFDVFLDRDFDWLAYYIIAPEHWEQCGSDMSEPWAVTYAYWHPGVW